jgi:hypothetical protein
LPSLRLLTTSWRQREDRDRRGRISEPCCDTRVDSPLSLHLLEERVQFLRTDSQMLLEMFGSGRALAEVSEDAAFAIFGWHVARG